MLLRVPENLTTLGLSAALQAIVDRHDAFRLRMERNDQGEWTVRFAPGGSLSAESWFTRLDLAGVDDQARREKILAAAREAEGRLDRVRRDAPRGLVHRRRS